jgi:hypothetical protein
MFRKICKEETWEERVENWKIILREIFKTGILAGIKQLRRDMVET